MLQIINMYVNGRREELAVDIRESLLETLREKLNLTSVKKGCGVGECGACTVLVDGVAVETAVELMGKGRRYTREELRKEIAGHLCRCTGYENILNALEKVLGYPKEKEG